MKIIDRFDVVPGKKALHKITYFANLQTDDFMFKWNNYGPYSEEVQQFFEDSYLDGVIDVKKESVNTVAVQYNISLTEQGRVMLQHTPASHDQTVRIDQAIDLSYDLLHGKKPREMELLASVHYLAKYSSDPENIWTWIAKLKPESHFSQDEVNKSIEILRNTIYCSSTKLGKNEKIN